VSAYKRVSPEIILEQLKLAQVQMLEHLGGLDPDAKAIFPVSWAGEDVSTNRFDIAREYTESLASSAANQTGGRGKIYHEQGIVQSIPSDLYAGTCLIITGVLNHPMVL
jgi:hypothetical protein